jgi:hypothetical protein
MNVQDGQGYTIRQGANVIPLLAASARPASRQTVAANWRRFHAVAEASDERAMTYDRHPGMAIVPSSMTAASVSRWPDTAVIFPINPYITAPASWFCSLDSTVPVGSSLN